MALRFGYECVFCGAQLPTRAALHIHKARQHREQYGGADLQRRPWDEDENPFENFPNAEAMERLYVDNEIYILAPHQLSEPNVLVFNFPVNGTVTDREVTRQLRAIYRHRATKSSFKANVVAGCILKNTEDDSLRYFRPETNMYLFDEPIQVDDARSLNNAVQEHLGQSLDDRIRSIRPNTKWVVQFITQLEWFVWPLNFALTGKSKDQMLPKYIVDNKSVITNFDYRGFEKCCIFVALAQFQTSESLVNENVDRRKDRRREKSADYRRNRRRVRMLLHQWLMYCKEKKIPGYNYSGPGDFPGVDVKDLIQFEHCFHVNVHILELTPNEVAQKRYISDSRYKETLYLNIHNRHLNWISNMKTYANKHKCEHCGRLFKTYFQTQCHQRACGRRSRHSFPSGVFRYKKTIFEALEEVGVVIPTQLRFSEYFCCWDMEALLAPHSDPIQTRKLKFTSVHKPISCSICSNVPGFTEPHCIINPKTEVLVAAMFARFELIRLTMVRENSSKWGGYLMLLREKIYGRRDKLKSAFESKHCPNPDIEDRDEATLDWSRRVQRFCKADPMLTHYLHLYRQFYHYIHQLTILSFNGARYDLHLVNAHFVKYLLRNESRENSQLAHIPTEMNDAIEEHESDIDDDDDEIWEEGLEEGNGSDNLVEPSTIESLIEDMNLHCMGKARVLKRANSYIAISNNWFSFLDVTQYLSQGTNLRSFLKAYGAKECKLYFCYEFLDSEEKLLAALPPYPSEAWTSRLKGGIDLLNDEYESWCENGRKGPAPKTGEENYGDIVRLWEERELQNLGDYLVIYNNADTKPFCDAIIGMQNEYFRQSLDVFKIAVSAPGLARIKSMAYAQQQNILFPLFNQKDCDLFYMLKESMTGGPSIIFSRYNEVGETYLRPDKQFKCESITGYDCSALYTYCFKAPMPSYMYVRRLAEDDFVPKYRVQFYRMYIWLEHMSETLNIHIRTKRNLGHDVRAGPYYLDGMAIGDNEQLIALEYNGCWAHNHPNCHLAKNSPNKDGYEKWLEKKHFLEDHDWEIICIWECEMMELMKDCPDLNQKLLLMKPPFLRKHPHAVSERQILEAILDESYFGFIICDIEVPGELHDLFRDFPVLFSNTEVSYDDLSEHMQTHVNEHGVKFTSRRMLISGMRAEEMLLNSRLAAWYLKHGLRITRIYQCLEFTPSYPFTQFVDDITARRKEAVLDPSRKIVGEIYKLLGNSAFGSSLLDKSKHTKTTHKEGTCAARMAVNNPRFRSMRPLGEEIYEIESGYKSISMDLPIYIGITILLEAKLRMCEWVYDFLYKFIDRTHITHCLMDTDSLYSMMSFPSLEQAVMPHMRDQYNCMLKGFCGAARHPQAFLPRTCCISHNTTDQKEPGCYHIECEPVVLIAMCSKTYICLDKQQHFKLSCKGVNNAAILRDSPLEKFKRVYNTQVAACAENCGFRAINGVVYTYKLEKQAIPFFYAKRKTLSDGGHTTPLLITLKPVPKKFFCLQTDAIELSPDHVMPFFHEETLVRTIRQAIILMKYMYITWSQFDTLPNPLNTFVKITDTTDASELKELGESMGSCDAYSRDLEQILELIISNRMKCYPALVDLLRLSSDQYIVNACGIDSVCGSGVNHYVTRWRKESYLQGSNYLGKIYMRYRHDH